MTSILGIPAVYSVEHRQFFNHLHQLQDECYYLFYENMLENVYSSKEEAEKAAREHFDNFKGE